ncbi:MAG: hypothetical protein KJ630_13265 [Proteobacteria bacterium]|nr:hypothetical protein [Pseudomonadota bacterium]
MELGSLIIRMFVLRTRIKRASLPFLLFANLIVLIFLVSCAHDKKDNQKAVEPKIPILDFPKHKAIDLYRTIEVSVKGCKDEIDIEKVNRNCSQTKRRLKSPLLYGENYFAPVVNSKSKVSYQEQNGVGYLNGKPVLFSNVLQIVERNISTNSVITVAIKTPEELAILGKIIEDKKVSILLHVSSNNEEVLSALNEFDNRRIYGYSFENITKKHFLSRIKEIKRANILVFRKCIVDDEIEKLSLNKLHTLGIFNTSINSVVLTNFLRNNKSIKNLHISGDSIGYNLDLKETMTKTLILEKGDFRYCIFKLDPPDTLEAMNVGKCRLKLKRIPSSLKYFEAEENTEFPELWRNRNLEIFKADYSKNLRIENFNKEKIVEIIENGEGDEEVIWGRRIEGFKKLKALSIIVKSGKEICNLPKDIEYLDVRIIGKLEGLSCLYRLEKLRSLILVMTDAKLDKQVEYESKKNPKLERLEIFPSEKKCKILVEEDIETLIIHGRNVELFVRNNIALGKLYIRRANIENGLYEQIERIRKIKTLILQDVKTRGKSVGNKIWGAISRIQGIEEIVLKGCSGITKMEEIIAKKTLSLLKVEGSYNNMFFDGILKFEDLKYLEISTNYWDGRDLDKICALKKLRRLYVQENKISKNYENNILACNNNKSLEVLIIKNSGLSNRIKKQLKKGAKYKIIDE